jgi:hypothetical protein
LGAAAVLAVIGSTSAQADVVISSQATANITCSGGVCRPTDTSAILNVGDLVTMLSAGNVTVSTSNGSTEAENIHVEGTLAWKTPNTLSLKAHSSILIAKPLTVGGTGGLGLSTGNDGTLSFSAKGRVRFKNLSSSLVINHTSYVLLDTVATLASAIATNPSGAYALSDNYDASPDGTYSKAPIDTLLTGILEGLGNAISNLTVSVSDQSGAGLIGGVDTSGIVRDLAVVTPNVSALSGSLSGALASSNQGTVIRCHSIGGTVTGNYSGGLVGNNAGLVTLSYSSTSAGSGSSNGGLVGDNYGTISLSYATGPVQGSSWNGGLVGFNAAGAVIEQSFATGRVSDSEFRGILGGLVGNNQGAITDSYANGAISSYQDGEDGGLVGANSGTIANAYSVGLVIGDTGSYVGGFVGFDTSLAGSIVDGYWDTDTSGVTDLSQGAGNIANDSGVTGLTTLKLLAHLPKGFDKTVWAENSQINGGLPYLRANRPPK